MLKSEILIHPEELSLKWINRMKSAGIHKIGIHPVGGKEAPRSLGRLLDQLQDTSFRQLLDDAADQGLEIEYELHAAGYLLDRTLFEEHPNYFRMNADGVRTSDYNFCVSNQEGMTLLAEHAADLAGKLYRSCQSFAFWMDDGRDTFCHCPSCQRFTASEQQLLAVNTMLKNIRNRFPDAQMPYLAYFGCVEPPRKVRPAEGVFLEYAPFEKYVSATDQSKQELILHEEDMILPLLECFGRSDAKVLEYWYDNSLFSDWKKPPKRLELNREAIKNDICRYYSQGFSGIATFGCFLGADYEELYGEPDLAPFEEALRACHSDGNKRR